MRRCIQCMYVDCGPLHCVLRNSRKHNAVVSLVFLSESWRRCETTLSFSFLWLRLKRTHQIWILSLFRAVCSCAILNSQHEPTVGLKRRLRSKTAEQTELLILLPGTIAEIRMTFYGDELGNPVCGSKWREAGKHQFDWKADLSELLLVFHVSSERGKCPNAAPLCLCLRGSTCEIHEGLNLQEKEKKRKTNSDCM